MSDKPRKSAWWILLRMAVWIGLIFAVGWFALLHPKTPVPAGWNPLVKFSPLDDIGPLTTWKMDRVMADAGSCMAALNLVADFKPKPDRLVSTQCHIKQHVLFSAVDDLNLRPINTRCDVALRLAMWNNHVVQPAAQKHFDQAVTGMRTQGSYNCRQIAGSRRMSHHATASAIDIAAIHLADGRKLELSKFWDHPSSAAFFRDIRDGACDWFSTVLGPDFNAAHADHFHMQSRGWGTCR